MTRSSKDHLDAKTMDGPVVKSTVADIFNINPIIFLIYHVMGAGYDFFTPLGTLTGGVLHLVGYRPFPRALQTMGTYGFVAGCSGMAFGLAGLANAAYKGPAASPPWTPEGRQMRVDGLKHNFLVRVVDLGVWNGIALAGITLFAARGPKNLMLSPGRLGVLQAISLGSAVGSVLSMGCVMYLKSNDK